MKVVIISAIGGIGMEAKEAIPFLITLLGDKAKSVRVAAARNLGAIGIDSEEAKKALNETETNIKNILAKSSLFW